MKNYINQLLDDLKQAEQNIPPTPNYKLLYPDHPAHDFGLEYIVAWECTPEQPMQELFGIPPEAFPPPEKLTRTQMKSLNQGIIDLWAAFGIGVDIPDKATILQCYKVFTKSWKEDGIQYFSPEMGGFSSMSFCNSDVETCSWEKFCSCKKYVKEWEKDYEDFTKSYEEGKNRPHLSSGDFGSPDIDFGKPPYDDDELPF
jgi:hypothetical protein